MKNNWTITAERRDEVVVMPHIRSPHTAPKTAHLSGAKRFAAAIAIAVTALLAVVACNGETDTVSQATDAGTVVQVAAPRPGLGISLADAQKMMVKRSSFDFGEPMALKNGDVRVIGERRDYGVELEYRGPTDDIHYASMSMRVVDDDDAYNARGFFHTFADGFMRWEREGYDWMVDGVDALSAGEKEVSKSVGTTDVTLRYEGRSKTMSLTIEASR